MSPINTVTLLSDAAVTELLSVRPIKPSMVATARVITDLINKGEQLVRACIASGMSPVTYRRTVYAGKTVPPVEAPLTPHNFSHRRVDEFRAVSKNVMAGQDCYDAAKHVAYDSYLLWVVQNDPAHQAAHAKALDAARAAAGSNTGGVTDSSGMCGGRTVDTDTTGDFFAPDVVGLKSLADKLFGASEEQPVSIGQFSATVTVDGREVGVVFADSMEEMVVHAKQMADDETARLSAAAHQARGIERLLTLERNEQLMREIGAISRRIEQFRERVSVARQAGEKDPVLAAFNGMGFQGKATVAGVIGR